MGEDFDFISTVREYTCVQFVTAETCVGCTKFEFRYAAQAAISVDIWLPELLRGGGVLGYVHAWTFSTC